MALQSELVVIYGSKKQRDTYESVWILEQVKLLALGIVKSYNVYHRTYAEEKYIYHTRQIPDEPVNEYFKRFESAKITADREGGDIL